MVGARAEVLHPGSVSAGKGRQSCMHSVAGTDALHASEGTLDECQDTAKQFYNLCRCVRW